MIHVLISGAAGMIGRKLTQRLARDGKLAGREITALSLVDITQPEKPAGFGGRLSLTTLDVSDPAAVARCIAARPDFVFHLAAVVSGEAEADFDKGYRINLDGTRHLLEAIRREGAKAPYRPRLIFTSSIAVFGAPFPEPIGDEFFTTPLTSYGTQKAISELLVADYSRREFLDGISIRLPTICIRPGKPNKAASGFFLQYPARAARRPGGGAAGVGGRASLACEPARRRRFSDPRVGDRFGTARCAAGADDARTRGHCG
jgi:D-erythronate 2-dehydrogenase